jgi:hypothetical protein
MEQQARPSRRTAPKFFQNGLETEGRNLAREVLGGGMFP